MLFAPPTYALFTGTAPTWSSTGTLSTFPVIAGSCTDLGIHDASFTLQISAKEDAGSRGGLFGTGPNGGSRQSMHIQTNADSSVIIIFGGNFCAAPAFADASFRGNSEWNTYAFIYDKDASTMTILINGAEVHQCNGQNSFLCSTGANEDFQIGCIVATAGCNHAMVGEIKDVSIWGGSALTQSELAVTASATGDPHLQNVHGERFDLMLPGGHVLINIPRSGPAENALLHVQAEASRLGGQCGDMYFTEVNVTGSWAFAKQAGGFKYVSQGVPRGIAGWIALGAVELKVVSARTASGIQYLNVYVKHLGRAGFAVGGLLGEDDHSEVSTPPAGCQTHLSLGRIRAEPHSFFGASPFSTAAGTFA